MKDEYFALSQRKQEVLREVVKEVVEIPSEEDKLRIKRLEQQLAQLREEYYILNQKKQEVVREVVEVSSETDKLRIRQLES